MVFPWKKETWHVRRGARILIECWDWIFHHRKTEGDWIITFEPLLWTRGKCDVIQGSKRLKIGHLWLFWAQKQPWWQLGSASNASKWTIGFPEYVVPTNEYQYWSSRVQQASWERWSSSYGSPLVVYTPGSISFVPGVFKASELDTPWTSDL